MLPLSDLVAFALSSVVLVALPGPDILYVLAVSSANGARRGVVAALGFATGVTLHAALVAVGIAQVLAVRPAALLILQVAGALYLVWCGVGAIRARSSAGGAGTAPPVTAGKVYRRAVVANILNPKVLLFFLSYLPQFVRADGGGVALQVLQLGFVFQLLTAIIFSLVALGAGALMGRWRGTHVGLVDTVSGGVLVALGVLLLAGGLRG